MGKQAMAESGNPFDLKNSKPQGSAFDDPSVQGAAGSSADVSENPFMATAKVGGDDTAAYMGTSGSGGDQFQAPEADHHSIEVNTFPGQKSQVDLMAQQIRDLQLENERLKANQGGFGGDAGFPGQAQIAPQPAMQRDDSVKNWPPCYPIARNNIPEDFPEDSEERETVVRAQWILYANFVAICWNLICQCAYAAGSQNSDKFSAVGIGIAFVIFGIPGAFYIWYRLLYIACQYRRLVFYFVTMGTLLASVLFWICAVIGFPGSGLAGFWVCMLQFDYYGDGDGDEMTYLITAIFMIIQIMMNIPISFFSFRLWQKVRGFYNGTGGTDKLKQDAEAAGNVAQAVAGAAGSVHMEPKNK